MIYRTDDAICGVYEIINKINGKKYIGQSINVLTRWKDHIHALNRGDSSCRLLQRAWHKYGADNFVFNILEECAEDQLDSVEIKYIQQFDTVKNGYNIESGGNVQKHLSEETKEKLRQSHLGKVQSEETRHKRSEAMRGEKNPMYGRHHTEEVKRRISECNSGRPGYPVSEETREKIRRANLGRVVSQETRDKISHACKGRTPHNKNLRSVYCIELNKHYDSAADAGRELNIKSGNITKCCEGERKTCGGYHWKYFDMLDNDVSTHNNTKL